MNVRFRRRVGVSKADARRERWREAAERMGGTLREGRRSFGDVIQVDHAGWTVWVETFVQNDGGSASMWTRARAHPDGWRGLRLTVRRRAWYDRVLGALGFGSEPPVAPALLERYVVQGKPSSRVPSLFADQGLTDALLDVPSARLEVRRPERKHRRSAGGDAAQVSCRTFGIETDADALARLVAVVGAALDALSRIGEVRGGRR